MTKPFISGLILAAGKSSRMGRPKQLLPFQGTILLDWVLSQVESAHGLDEVIIVLGAEADEVRCQLRITRAQVVINPVVTEGCSASYKTGIAALDPRSEAVMVILGDQPGVDATIIDHAAADWRENSGTIALVSYRGHRGHPMIFARALYDQLQQLQGDKAAWKILDAHPEWVRDVELDRAFPEDVDTWQDYETLLREMTRPVL
jgi:molybdenum cofactor cytidylyltransferase